MDTTQPFEYWRATVRVKDKQMTIRGFIQGEQQQSTTQELKLISTEILSKETSSHSYSTRIHIQKRKHCIVENDLVSLAIAFREHTHDRK